MIGRIEGSRSTGQLYQTRTKSPVERKTKKEIRDLIYRMVGENRWRAPRIYSELLMLGFNDISEATVSRYLRKYQTKHPDKKKQQSWMTFLRNYRDVFSAMGFFIVPTIKFNILYAFFIIDHKRRIIRHFSITNHHLLSGSYSKSAMPSFWSGPKIPHNGSGQNLFITSERIPWTPTWNKVQSHIVQESLAKRNRLEICVECSLWLNKSSYRLHWRSSPAFDERVCRIL